MKKGLSARLSKVFECASGRELWDIGCDHGLLALHNVFAQKFQRVVCVDKSNHIMSRLPIKFRTTYRIPEERLHSIHFLEKDGCDLDWTLPEGTVAIAGVGSLTIHSIINSAPTEHRWRLNWVVVPQDGPEFLLERWQNLFPDHFQLSMHEVLEGPRRRTVMHLHPKLQ